MYAASIHLSFFLIAQVSLPTCTPGIAACSHNKMSLLILSLSSYFTSTCITIRIILHSNPNPVTNTATFSGSSGCEVTARD
jgi:hypothetical protein